MVRVMRSLVWMNACPMFSQTDKSRKCTLLLSPNTNDSRINDAAVPLLRKSLIQRSLGGDHFTCHRIIREAILQSIDPTTLPQLFDWAVFALNECFPQSYRGGPMYQHWRRCAEYHIHLSALIQTYHRFASSLRLPIMLCEIIRRCAW